MSTIGKYDIVTIAQVRQAAKKLLLKENDISIDDTIDFWIIEGLKNLNCISTLTKINCEIEICDGYTAQLPTGCVQLLSFRLPCSESNTDPNGINYTYYYDKPFFKDNNIDCSAGWQGWGNTCQINQGFIMFNEEQPSGNIEISYMGANINENGERILYERYMRALYNFAAYNYGLAISHLKTVTSLQLGKWEQLWLLQRDMLISEDVAMKAKEQANQLRIMMRTPYYRVPLQPSR